MFTYRISQTRYARLLTTPGFSARWNHEGRYVLYTGGSAALSCLEVAVHKSGAALLSGDFSLAIFYIPDAFYIEEITIEDLRKQADNWITVENYYITQDISNDWMDSGRSAVLKVPSAIIQNEFNYLLNINHPDFSEIRITEVNKFTFDSRLKTDPGSGK